MKVKENKSIDLKTPRFLVDHPLNKEIEKYDVLRHLNHSGVTGFIGCSGSGKTSLMLSLLTHKKPKIWRKQFESIIVVMPKASRNSLKNNIFDKHLAPEVLYDALSEQAMDEIAARVRQNSEDGIHTLLILDDVASALKNGDVAKQLQHLCYAYRHYRVNILLLVQTLRTIPLSIRKNLTNLIIFYKPRFSEWEAIVAEFLEITKEESKELYQTVFKKKYDWALINLTSGKIYSMFNEVLYKDAESEETKS